MKSPELIRRIIDLAAGDPPVLVSVTDDATPEDVDEALRLITADRAVRADRADRAAPPDK